MNNTNKMVGAQEEWEKGLLQIMTKPHFTVDEIKSFIRNLLEPKTERERYVFHAGAAAMRSRLKKLIEGMQLPEKKGHYGPFDQMHIQHNIGWNSALTDLLSALNEI